jgi:three-Cys-motif partner protein
MTHSDDHFDAFEDHTLLKHAYLEAYLPAWAFKLLHSQGEGGRVHFIDSFAGAGKDNEGNPGSPTIACRIAQQVRAKREADGVADARMVVWAIEKKTSYFKALTTQLERFRALENDFVTALHGTAAAHIAAIAPTLGDTPALYFLDPFGVDGLDASLYPAMLAGPRNEIFALFNNAGAARLRGVLANTQMRPRPNT